jgi:hypothetical protein
MDKCMRPLDLPVLLACTNINPYMYILRSEARSESFTHWPHFIWWRTIPRLLPKYPTLTTPLLTKNVLLPRPKPPDLLRPLTHLPVVRVSAQKLHVIIILQAIHIILRRQLDATVELHARKIGLLLLMRGPEILGVFVEPLSRGHVNVIGHFVEGSAALGARSWGWTFEEGALFCHFGVVGVEGVGAAFF